MSKLDILNDLPNFTWSQAVTLNYDEELDKLKDPGSTKLPP